MSNRLAPESLRWRAIVQTNKLLPTWNPIFASVLLSILDED
jgi:hypothetical protein